MQLQLLLNPGPAKEMPDHVLVLGETTLPLELVRNPRARRYVLRLGHDGIARVTVPRGGTFAEARRMAQRHHEWLEKQLRQRGLERVHNETWSHGTEIMFRGSRVRLEVAEGEAIRTVRLADQSFATDLKIADLRPAVERHLWKTARLELPPRVCELATLHSIVIGAILAVVAGFLAYESKGLLIGEGVDDKTLKSIRSLARNDEAVAEQPVAPPPGGQRPPQQGAGHGAQQVAWQAPGDIAIAARRVGGGNPCRCVRRSATAGA